MPNLAAVAAKIIRSNVPRDHLIDLADSARASRKSAGDHAVAMGLVGRSANRIAGMSAHELMEQKLCELTTAAGGLALEGGCFPGTALRNYQTIGLHGNVILGRASISEIGAMPTQNFTRANGASLNRRYGSQTYLRGLEPSISDFLYALLLTCRDRENVRDLAEVAIGVLEPDFSGFILYEPIDRFLSGYDATDDVEPKTPQTGAIISLKTDVKPFVGGEGVAPPDVENDNNQAG